MSRAQKLLKSVAPKEVQESATSLSPESTKELKSAIDVATGLLSTKKINDFLYKNFKKEVRVDFEDVKADSSFLRVEGKDTVIFSYLGWGPIDVDSWDKQKFQEVYYVGLSYDLKKKKFVACRSFISYRDWK